MKVIAYTGGHNSPARIPRVQHYISPLRALNIDLIECPAYSGVYPPEARWKRPLWGLCNLAEHALAAFSSYKYDVTLLQREMLSRFVTLEPVTKSPRVLDVDDAIWVYGGERFASRLARLCEYVICGNEFLASHFSQWNPNVSVIPTSVDTDQFVPADDRNSPSRPVIGWLGLSSGFRFLFEIEPALKEILSHYPDAIFRVISDKRPKLLTLPERQFEFVRYRAEDHVSQIQQMTIGIMPLDDSVAARGKCSFKMLQYMACEVPVVVSNVGMNVEILQRGEVGFGADTCDEWVHSMRSLLEDDGLRRRCGQKGRRVVFAHYSVSALAPRLAEVLFHVAKVSSPHCTAVGTVQ